MAAFQRGIGLAEAQQNVDSEHTGAAHTQPDHITGSAHREPAAESGERATRIPLHPLLDPARTETTPTFPASPLDARHTDVGATTKPHPMDVSPMDVSPMDVGHMDVTPMDPAHIAEARPASARGIDHPTRHDGSAPAG
jgi:hypothetical protein